jgi:hypothetical protein
MNYGLANGYDLMLDAAGNNNTRSAPVSYMACRSELIVELAGRGDTPLYRCTSSMGICIYDICSVKATAVYAPDVCAARFCHRSGITVIQCEWTTNSEIVGASPPYLPILRGVLC